MKAANLIAAAAGCVGLYATGDPVFAASYSLLALASALLAQWAGDLLGRVVWDDPATS